VQLCQFQLFWFFFFCFDSFFFGVGNGKECNFYEYTGAFPGIYYPTDVFIGTYSAGVNISIIYACSNDGSTLSIRQYTGTFNCANGTSVTTTTINQGDTGYQFLCTGQDCSLIYTLATYNVTGCTTHYSSFQEMAYVTGICYNSTTPSYKYSCGSSSYSVTEYSDKDCSSSLSSTSVTDGCESLVTSSMKYEVVKCGNAIRSFSTFMSFVMVAISFFIY